MNATLRAFYTCNHGYRLAGGSSRTCQSSGRWSGVEPRCQGNFKYSSPLHIGLHLNGWRQNVPLPESYSLKCVSLKCLISTNKINVVTRSIPIILYTKTNNMVGCHRHLLGLIPTYSSTERIYSANNKHCMKTGNETNAA